MCRKERERILKYRLVGIVAVYAHTHVKEQVFKRELVLDVSSHVNWLEGTYRVGSVTGGIYRGKEVIECRVAGEQLTHVVVSEIAYEGPSTWVNQFLRREE